MYTYPTYTRIYGPPRDLHAASAGGTPAPAINNTNSINYILIHIYIYIDR